MILRRATPADAPALAVILRTCFRVSLSFLPELHSAEDDLRYMSARLAEPDPVWVAEVGGAPAAFITLREDWIDHLYVHPEQQGRGLGPALLAKALEDGRPRQLWTFQQNARARRFYEAHGFRPVEFTDGAGNEERTPDVRYVWNPSAPGAA